MFLFLQGCCARYRCEADSLKQFPIPTYYNPLSLFFLFLPTAMTPYPQTVVHLIHFASELEDGAWHEFSQKSGVDAASKPLLFFAFCNFRMLAVLA